MDVNKNLKDSSELYNMIWTAGFNSGLKVGSEIIEQKILPEADEIQKRADELIKEDAEGIEQLLKLKSQMGM